MITHPESAIPAVKSSGPYQALLQTKLVEVKEMTAVLFKILKDDAVKMLHLICPQIWKTQQWPWNWKRSGFIPIPKKGNVKQCSHYHTIAFISHASKVTLQILQAGALNQEPSTWTKNFQMCKPDLENQRSNCQHPLDHRKRKRIPKNIYFWFLDCAKVFDCVDHNKLWKILKEMK